MRALLGPFWHTALWSGYLLALVVFSLLPVELPATAAHSDKVMHLLAYALLVLFWPRPWELRSWSMVGLAAALGLVLEVGQAVLPTGRCMDPQDAVANTLGAMLGLLGRVLFAFFRSRRGGRA